MDKSSAFVKAAVKEMCQALQSSRLGYDIPGTDIHYALSASALYQRPDNSSNTTCFEHPENCQNALGIVTFNRGLGSPPCPPTKRLSDATGCMNSLMAAARGW